jgi:hypothetical protein
MTRVGLSPSMKTISGKRRRHIRNISKNQDNHYRREIKWEKEGWERVTTASAKICPCKKEVYADTSVVRVVASSSGLVGS